MMHIIRLSDNDLKNLIQFLNRVELKGIVEAKAFIDIIQAINNSTKEEILNNDNKINNKN